MGQGAVSLLTALILGGLWAFLPIRPAAAEQMYRYVDSQGTVHFSNVPTDQRFVPITKDNKRISPKVSGRYDELIRRIARQHQVPPALVKAVIASESNFNASARSPKGAQGLMQLMPATARELGVRDSYVAEQNIQGGTAYLSQLITRYGDWTHALAAYNAGPTAVEEYGGIPPFPETQAYVRRVLKYYRAYDVDFM
jgi:soluble lytic murein transglycosylase-like protein